MEIELEGLKRRLNKAERELVNSKEECIHLTTNTQALEREVCNSAIFLMLKISSVFHFVSHSFRFPMI